VIALSLFSVFFAFLTWWRVERHLGAGRASILVRWAEGVGLAAVIPLAIAVLLSYLGTSPQGDRSGSLRMVIFQVTLPFALIGLYLALRHLLPHRFGLVVSITFMTIVGALVILEYNPVVGMIDRQQMHQYTHLSPLSLAGVLCFLSSSIICGLVPYRGNPSSKLGWLRAATGIGAGRALLIGIVVGMPLVFVIGFVGASKVVIWRSLELFSSAGLTVRHKVDVATQSVA
jgi:hypothetical protein